MKCPNCNYDPTMSEIQLSPDKCVKCGSGQLSDNNRYLKVSRKFSRYPLIAAFLFLAVAAVYYSYDYYLKSVLISQVEISMRRANGLVAEVLDKDARLTNAGFLEKVPRRIMDLDSLLAESLAIDDRIMPGVKEGLSDYVRASRTFLYAFSHDLKNTISVSVAEASLAAHESYAKSLEGSRYINMKEDELRRAGDKTLTDIELENDLSKKIDLLSIAAEHAKNQEKRSNYFKALSEAEIARAQKADSAKALKVSAERIGFAGTRLSKLTGKKMPTQAWEFPGQ